jgi:STE24 endopeptidase
MSEVTLDAERQQRAKIYERIQRRLLLIDLALGAAYALAWLIFGWAANLKAALTNITTNDWLLVAGFGLIFGGVYYLIDLPLSYYSGFVLPKRFDLSNDTLKGWIGDQIKELIIAGILGGLIFEVIYAVLRVAPDTWWLWAAALLLLFEVVLANLAPILIMPLFYKFVPLGDEQAELADRLIRLAEQAGTRVRGVYKFDMSRRTKEANAALTGLGNTRRIILGDTLLTEFTPDEIETVLAHELGHHVHKDIPLSMAFETVLTLVGLYLASLGLRWGVATFGFAGVADIAALPLFGLVMGAYGLITLPLGNAFSRWRERLADEYALQATHKSAAFASALTRLANQNLADVDPEPWVEFLLHSHPALRKRIALAQAAGDRSNG